MDQNMHPRCTLSSYMLLNLATSHVVMTPIIPIHGCLDHVRLFTFIMKLSYRSVMSTSIVRCPRPKTHLATKSGSTLHVSNITPPPTKSHALVDSNTPAVGTDHPLSISLSVAQKSRKHRQCTDPNFILSGPACVRPTARLGSVHLPEGRVTDTCEKESPLPVTTRMSRDCELPGSSNMEYT
ncbi:hypothetical protein CRG98_014135 [Punica granatum]|uniref:Uncharacterized protein n=1 Tax=Punica granatum TaxID=22663 RepID=A0A2I0KAB6_PUNGR|nr:hypothetical protein CRG98_014135 [Punica granatum]